MFLLTFELSFEVFDFNDEEFLNDLKRVSHYYDNFVVLEYKEDKQKISKEFESLHDAIKNIDEHSIQFRNLIFYNLDIQALKKIT
jgi:hypothetical protein